MTDAKKLAERIAEVLADEERRDLAPILDRLDAISLRLDRLESFAEMNHGRPTASPTHSGHPSQDKFSIAEAIADQIFDKAGQEKACTFEPNGKPCDHCSMCSSRGF